MKNVAIIGGGLAGLVSGVELSKKGVPCTLFEKKRFPFHRVCGEYVSNEALPYLRSSGLYPENLRPATITRFELSSVRGHTATMPLDLGGFGISRHGFDHFLCERARELGVNVIENCEVTDIHFSEDRFSLSTNGSAFTADVVIGAFGKRSRLDLLLERKFTKRRSPFVGIKYHLRSRHPDDLIALHNFDGGYAGVVCVEAGITNFCYLVERRILQRWKTIGDMEHNVLAVNPAIRELMMSSDHGTVSPVVINEISFETKGPVEARILMAGDAAGMITPLCGNGMAMAIHAAKLVSAAVEGFCRGRITRDQLERRYAEEWRRSFARQLSIGRSVQNLFGNRFMSSLAVDIMRQAPSIAGLIMRNTHGKPF